MTVLRFRSVVRTVVGLGCLVGFAGGAVAQEQGDPPPPLPAGIRAPAFTSTTLSGHKITLRSLRGHVVLIDFWATWCGPCQMAMPTLEKLYKKFSPGGFRVVGMSVDDIDSVQDVRPLIKQLGITYTITTTPNANSAPDTAYKVNGMFPSQFLIDKKGIVRWSQAGYSEDERTELTALIKKLQRE